MKNKIVNYSVSYHWSDRTYERAFLCATHREECGDLYVPDYLKQALERYAQELEESEEV
jgi:hypothetical protein